MNLTFELSFIVIVVLFGFLVIGASLLFFMFLKKNKRNTTLKRQLHFLNVQASMNQIRNLNVFDSAISSKNSSIHRINENNLIDLNIKKESSINFNNDLESVQNISEVAPNLTQRHICFLSTPTKSLDSQSCLAVVYALECAPSTSKSLELQSLNIDEVLKKKDNSTAFEQLENSLTVEIPNQRVEEPVNLEISKLPANQLTILAPALQVKTRLHLNREAKNKS